MKTYLGFVLAGLATLLLTACQPIVTANSGATIAGAPAKASRISVEALKNATYSGIYDEPITLTNGMYEGQPFVAGDSAHPTVEIIDGAELYGDLDGDGVEDSVVFLLENTGGTAVFTYIAAQLNQDSQPVDAGAIQVGSRIQVRSIALADGQIELNVVTQGPGDGECCASHKASYTYAVQDGQLAQTSGQEAALEQISSADLEGATWKLVELKTASPVPADSNVTISFGDGPSGVSGSGGCNGYTASFSLNAENPMAMTVGPIAATEKACPDPIGSQEAAYFAALIGVTQWGYEFGHLALHYTDDQTGEYGRLLFAPVAANATTPASAVYMPTYSEVECPFVVPYSVDITCGMLTVPENRERADSRMIQVFVQTIHALSEQPQPDPIVVLPGGPGDDASHARNLFYRLPAREDRDFILIDPRGTGYSVPNLNCMENGGIGFAYDSAVGAAKDCYERLKQEGIDFAGYTTAEQVTDVADLAQALGLTQINLHGGSYGTRVAIRVADRYPELVRSMMLDGVMPANVVAQLEEPVNVYNVFRKVFADCAADAMCNAANPDLMERMLALVDRYDAEPFPDGVNFAESGAELVAYIFGQIYGGTAAVPAFVTALYEEDFARACNLLGGLGVCSLPEETAATAVVSATAAMTVSAAISASEPLTGSQPLDWRSYFTDPEDPFGSDAEQVTALMRNLNAATPEDLFARLDSFTQQQFEEVLGALDAPGAPDPSNEGVYYSVWCSEEAPFYDLADVQNVAAHIPSQFGAFPTARATELKDICNLWTVPPASAADKVVKLSYVPTLIVNGTHDPITPPMWAKRAAAYLENVHVELFPGFGHVILSTGNDCMAGMMGAFYGDPTQGPDAACLDAITPQWAH